MTTETETSALVVKSEDVDEYLVLEAQVRSWMGKVLGVVFAEPLKGANFADGVILCQIMLQINKSYIPCIYESSDVPYKIRENVLFFLHAATEFGVPKSQLFSVSDVEEGNVVPIVHCLMKIAEISTQRKAEDKTASSNRRDTHFSLPSVNKQVAVISEEDLSADERKKLRRAVILNKEQKMRRQKTNTALRLHHDMYRFSLVEDLIKNDGLYLKRVIQLQALFRTFRQRRTYLKIKRDLAYRQRVAREILSTESTYTESLQMVVDLYLDPLQTAANKPDAPCGIVPVLTKSDIRSIFSDLVVILRFHKESVLSAIAPRVEHWHPFQCLGDIFLTIVSFMKIYSQYVQNYSQSIATCERLRREMPKFTEFLADRQAIKRTNKMTLAGLLIMPIQRIPRYHLLLSDLVKHTWPDHPDYLNLKAAAKQIEEMSTLLDQKKKMAEGLKRLCEVAALFKHNLSFNLAEPHRRLIREQQFGQMVLFLFNDMVIAASISSPLKRSKNKTVPKQKQKVKQKQKKEESIMNLKLMFDCQLQCIELVPMPDWTGFSLRSMGSQIGFVTVRDQPVRLVQKFAEKFNTTQRQLQHPSEDNLLRTTRGVNLNAPDTGYHEHVDFKRSESTVFLENSLKTIQSHIEAVKIQSVGVKSRRAKRELNNIKENLTDQLHDLNSKIATKRISRMKQIRGSRLTRQRSKSCEMKLPDDINQPLESPRAGGTSMRSASIDDRTSTSSSTSTDRIDSPRTGFVRRSNEQVDSPRAGRAPSRSLVEALQEPVFFPSRRTSGADRPANAFFSSHRKSSSKTNVKRERKESF